MTARQNKGHDSAGPRATTPLSGGPHGRQRHVSIAENGQVLAEAIITAPDKNNDARAEVTVAPGHLPVGTRQKMADAVHEAVCDGNAAHLTATVPHGDAELVNGFRDHLSKVDLRAAGASSIIEGDIGPR